MEIRMEVEGERDPECLIHCAKAVECEPLTHPDGVRYTLSDRFAKFPPPKPSRTLENTESGVRTEKLLS